MTTLHRTALLAVLLAGWTPGCSRVRPPVEPREDPHGTPQIQLADRDLQRSLAVRAPIVSTDEAGLLYITVPVRNTTRHPMTIEYKAIFFDKMRNPIQETTWFPKTMTPHSQESIHFNATTNRVDDFQVTIRPAM